MDARHKKSYLTYCSIGIIVASCLIMLFSVMANRTYLNQAQQNVTQVATKQSAEISAHFDEQFAWLNSRALKIGGAENEERTQLLVETGSAFEYLGFGTDPGSCVLENGTRLTLNGGSFADKSFDGHCAIERLPLGTRTAAYSFALSVPVEGANGRVGYLFGILSEASMEKLLTTEEYDGMVFSLLCSAQGDIYAGSANMPVSLANENLFAQTDCLQIDETSNPELIREHLSAGDSGVFTGTGLGQHRTGYYTPLGQTGWSEVCVLADSAIKIQAVNATLICALVIAVVLSLSLVAAYLFYRRASSQLRIKEKEISELEELRKHDKVTGLLNYEAGWVMVQEYMADEGRDKKNVLLLVELSGFQKLKSRHGFESGESIMRQAAELIERLFFTRDILISRGDGQFIIYMKNVPDSVVATDRARELHKTVNFIHIGENEAMNLSCVTGIAYWSPESGINADELLRRAELALSTLKMNGGDMAYCCYEDEENQSQEDTDYGAISDADGGLNIQLRTFLAHIYSGLMLVEARDAALTVLFMSENCAKMSGCEDSTGLSDPERAFAFVDEADLPLLRVAMLKCAQSGEAVDVVYRLRSGAWNRMNTLKLDEKEQHGRCILLCIVTDVSDIKHEELENELRKQKLEILLDSSRLVTFEIDIRSHTLFLPEKYFTRYDGCGSVVENAPGPMLEGNYISQDSREEYLSMFENIYSDEGDGSVNIKLKSRNTAEYLPVKLTWRTVADSRGEPVTATGVIEPLMSDADGSNTEIMSISALQTQITLQEQYFYFMKQYQQELRQYRHDYKNNIIGLSALVNSGDLQGAKDYLGKLSSLVSKNRVIVNSENPAVGAMISEKLAQAQDAGIDIEDRLVGLPANLGVDTMDLCLAVGCAMDNAIESCKRAAPFMDRTFLSLKLIKQKGVIIFKLINSSVTPPPDKGKDFTTSKEDRINHGFGLKNIRTVVEKYHGVLRLEAGVTEFNTSFTLFADDT